MIKKLNKKFPNLIGNLIITKIENLITVEGQLYTNEYDKDKIEDFIIKELNKKHGGFFPSIDIKYNALTVIEDDQFETTEKYETVLDEVKIVYQGYLPTNILKRNDKFKLLHNNNKQKLDNIVKVLDFITPIVVDKNLNIIDGNFRHEVATDNQIQQVPVVILDVDEVRADFLRLSLNRMAEFQRWKFKEIDKYVDDTPQAQPILEPIGFFGRKVLPVSFFSNTVTEYIIDPYNTKQQQYAQEEGLAEWAAYRRAEMERLSEEKRTPKPKKTPEQGAISLFDLTVPDDAFLETYDKEQETKELTDKWKNIAGEITDKLDEAKKKEIEENGGVWQAKSTSTKEKARQNRENAIGKIKSYDLTADERFYVLANLDDFADVYKNEKQLTEKLTSDSEFEIKAKQYREKAIEKIKSYEKLTENEISYVLENIDDFADVYKKEKQLIEKLRGDDE